MDRHDMARAALESLDRLEWQRSPSGNRFVVIDGLLPECAAREIAAAFDPAAFVRRESWRERKRTTCFLERQPRPVAEAARALLHPHVVARIADLAGFGALEADPSLYAGGMSAMCRGDFLNPHIDNSHDGKRRRYRRINLLYYATPGWADEMGGHLELWDRAVREPLTIHSRFNRLVLMETTPTSWHSVSPVRGDGWRRCISSYYFSKASPTGGEYYHVTSFTGRPGQHLRRALAPIDNGARQLARHFGARRRSDSGNGHAITPVMT